MDSFLYRNLVKESGTGNVQHETGILKPETKVIV